MRGAGAGLWGQVILGEGTLILPLKGNGGLVRMRSDVLLGQFWKCDLSSFGFGFPVKWEQL